MYVGLGEAVKAACVRSFMVCCAVVSTEEGINLRECNISLVRLGVSKGSARKTYIRPLVDADMDMSVLVYQPPLRFHQSAIRVPGNAGALHTPLSSINSRSAGFQNGDEYGLSRTLLKPSRDGGYLPMSTSQLYLACLWLRLPFWRVWCMLHDMGNIRVDYVCRVWEHHTLLFLPQSMIL